MTFRLKDQSGEIEPLRVRGPLPYEPDEWSRRLAEARARREATLKERGAIRPGRASMVRTAISGEDGEPARLASPPAASQTPEAPTQSNRDRSPDGFLLAWRRPLALLLAGGLAGASLTVAASAALTSFRQPPRAAVTAAIAPVIERAMPEPSTATPERSAIPPEQPAPTPEQLAAKPQPDTAIPPEQPPPTLEQLTARPQPDTTPERPSVPPEQQHAATPELLVVTPEQPVVAHVRPRPAPRMDAGTETAVDIDLANISVWVEDPAPGPLPPTAADAGQVVVLAPPTVGSAARTDVELLIHEAGWQEPSLRASPFTVRSTHVRYYHAEDRQSAEKLASLFSAGARDFTDYRPSPPTGMVELWLAGGGGPESPVPAPRRTNPLINTLERIAVALDRFE